MLEYISLIRGINVGGKTLKMDVLKSIYASLGFADMVTYIQSGNVLFNAGTGARPPIAASIEQGIKKKSGLEVSVILRTRNELAEIIAKNPFVKSRKSLVDKMHVTFLGELPGPEPVKALSSTDAKGDEYKVVGREIYLVCPNGYGRTILNNNFLEKRLKCAATTRNWATVNKLLELADSRSTVSQFK